MASSMFLFVTFVEAALVGINLFLFSYGYPETVRKSLWEEGGLKLFNSNPRLRIYFYANHLEPPEIPYIWSQKFTDFNLAVAILTFCVFATRSGLRFMGVLNKWIECFLQCCLLPFWAFSLAGQQSSDYSDDKHPSRVPWYLTHSCTVAERGNQAACRMAQASFALTIITICFYAGMIWRSVAYESFDYILNHYQIRDEAFVLKSSARSYEVDEVALEEVWSDDESPLMRAWDNL